MLAVQVQYFNYLENQRHNLETEKQGRTQLDINQEQADIARYGVETGRLSYQESVRHNVTSEEENHRHNVATESLGLATLEETTRHNLAYEAETQRHNIQQEGIGWQQANASSLQAQASLVSANAAKQRAEQEVTQYRLTGYEAERSRTELNRAQIPYYQSKTGVDVFGSTGGFLSGVSSIIKLFK